MKLRFAKRYRKALLAYLQQGAAAELSLARALGRRALATGMPPLELIQLHEQIFLTHSWSSHTARERAALLRRAGVFFAEAVSPCKRIVELLSRRTVKLAALNLELEREIARRRPPRSRRPAPLRQKTALTSRQADVLRLIAEGKTNKEIAAQLNVAVKTIEKHRGHLMQKLQIHNTAGLTRHAIESGLAASGVGQAVFG
jgi:DNA-binding NarL/FixJ family response regulator